MCYRFEDLCCGANSELVVGDASYSLVLDRNPALVGLALVEDLVVEIHDPVKVLELSVAESAFFLNFLVGDVEGELSVPGREEVLTKSDEIPHEWEDFIRDLVVCFLGCIRGLDRVAIASWIHGHGAG